MRGNDVYRAREAFLDLTEELQHDGVSDDALEALEEELSRPGIPPEAILAGMVHVRNGLEDLGWDDGQ